MTLRNQKLKRIRRKGLEKNLKNNVGNSSSKSHFSIFWEASALITLSISVLYLLGLRYYEEFFWTYGLAPNVYQIPFPSIIMANWTYVIEVLLYLSIGLFLFNLIKWVVWQENLVKLLKSKSNTSYTFVSRVIPTFLPLLFIMIFAFIFDAKSEEIVKIANRRAESIIKQKKSIKLFDEKDNEIMSDRILYLFSYVGEKQIVVFEKLDNDSQVVFHTVNVDKLSRVDEVWKPREERK